MEDYQPRSLEDIKKEKDSFVDKIDQNKTSIEIEISSIVDKLDNTLEEINKKTSLDVTNIISFSQKLERLYNSKLESASNSLIKSTSIFEEKAKKIKTGFNGIYIIILLVIIYLIIEIITYYGSGSSFASNSSVSSDSTTQLLPFLIPFIAILLILILVIIIYKNIGSIDNSSELSSEIDNIVKHRGVPISEMPLYPQKIEIEKSFFDEKKTALTSLIVTVGKLIPIVEKIYDEVTLLVEYQQMVNDFESSLEFYNLIKDKKFFEEIEKCAPADTHILKDKDLWKKVVARKISYQFNAQAIGQKFTFSENLLLLLYGEHNNEPSISVFREIIESEKEIQVLASILIDSKRLTESSNYEYKKEDIVAIIRKNESFSLPNINDSLSNLLLRYEELMKNFELCLEFYNLIEDKKFIENIREFVPLCVYIKNKENLWKEITAKKISCQLNTKIIGQKFAFSENLLLLLYGEHNNEPSISVFREIIESEKEIQVLASILIYSCRLTKSSNYEYKKEDIAAIIKKNESFSLPNINNTLSNSFLTLNYLDSYVEFLKKNGVEISYEPTIEYIIDKSESISFEKRDTRLAYNLGFDNFNKIDYLNGDYVDGFARASLALKFHDDVSLREMVCKC